MSGAQTDKAKGRAKETAAKASDDSEFGREGKVDRASGAVKEKADRAAEGAKDLVGKD